MGKKWRDEYVKSKRITWHKFIKLGQKIKLNGITAIPRENTDDLAILFYDREAELKPYFAVGSGGVFVDVGSNVGYYTLQIASNPDVKVISIEANPETYAALCRNIECNGFRNVVTINKAVSSTKGRVILYNDFDSDGVLWAGHASMIEPKKEDTLLDTDYNAETVVESDTLDDMLKENAIRDVDLLKIDIEGAEVQALEGATETLKRSKRVIVEVHGNNLDNVKFMLEKNKFKIKVFSAYIIADKAPV